MIKLAIQEYQPKSIADVEAMLKDMFKGTFEDMLKGEPDTELGYGKNDPSPKETSNRRNGSYKKTVQSTTGELEPDIPRDREGKYEPILIPKGERDISGLEEKVICLYGKGTSDAISPMSSKISTASG